MNDPFNVDLYDTGACVCELDAGGNVIAVLAWARNDMAARRAFFGLVDQYPRKRLTLKRKAFVMERHEP